MRVFEKSGTRGLHQWDRIATRVIVLGSGAVINGTLLPLDQDTSEELLASLRRVRAKTGDITAELAHDLGREASAEVAGEAVTPELLLARGAFAFTNLWLASMLRGRLDEAPPAISNRDGKPLEFIILHFPLRPGVTLTATLAVLAGMPALRRADTIVCVGSRRRERPGSAQHAYGRLHCGLPPWRMARWCSAMSRSPSGR